MKKKLSAVIIMFLFVFAFVSCDFLSSASTTSNISTEAITTTAITSTTTSIQTTTEITTTEAITTTEEQTTTELTTTEATTTTVNTAEPFYPTGYSLLQDELDYVGIPSMGDVNVLVFAVDFSDYPNDSYGISLNDLEIAFNGESSDLDYESLKSFYQKSSFNKLNLNADIYGYYTAEHPSSYYEDLYDKYWAVDPITGEWLYDETESSLSDSDIINEVLTYYDDQIDYSQYDSNDDGFIDGIYIIYTHPVSWSSGSDLWWSYQYYYAYNNETFDGMMAYYFSWIGSEFFTHTNDDIDARALIHETGHMMGLEDYYDYDTNDVNNNSGGLGGADMMDSNTGDHGPFSKILLGWITPLVIEEPMTVDLLSYEDTGEVLLLTSHWNNTIFDEYLLIMFYTPTGLYEQDAYNYFSSRGVLIYHVSAAIDNGYDVNSAYYSIFNNNNTDSKNKLIDIIEADMNNYIDLRSQLQYSDLFMPGDALGGNVYGNYQWYTGVYLQFIVDIISIDEDSVIIDIRT